MLLEGPCHDHVFIVLHRVLFLDEKRFRAVKREFLVLSVSLVLVDYSDKLMVIVRAFFLWTVLGAAGHCVEVCVVALDDYVLVCLDVNAADERHGILQD